MKKILTFLLILSVVLFSFNGVWAEDPVPESKNLRILFTHDLHSAILPYKTADNGGKVTVSGGFARLQTLINQNRNDNSILVDAGDFSMGSLFNSLFETDAPELNLMSAMGYDALTLGNHEFDYGLKALAADLKVASENPLHPALIASNINYGSDAASTELKSAMENYGALPCKIVSKGDVKIGLFALLSEQAQDFTNSESLSFSDCAETAKTCVKTLEDQGADVIICLSHGGTNEKPSQSEDQILARSVDGIDVIISGHTHSVLESPIVENNTLIVSAGTRGANLGVLDLSIDAFGNISQTGYSLKASDSSVPQDETIQTAVNVYTDLVQTQYLDALGKNMTASVLYSDVTLESEDQWYTYGNHSISNLIADAYIYEETQNGKNIDVSIICSGLIRDTVYQGNMTEGDLFNILSLGSDSDGSIGYSLVDFYFYGSELKTLCQAENAIYPLMKDAQMTFSGLRFTYNKTRLPLDRVMNVEVCDASGNWEPIEEDRLYHVCCSEYLLQQSSLFSKYSLNLISINPRDEAGNIVSDISTLISKNSKGQSIKEWISLSNYVQSFEKNQNKIPTLPESYHTPGNCKTAVESNLTNQFVNPSRYARMIYGIVLVLMIIIFLIVRHIVKKHRRKRLFNQKF